MKFSVPTAWLLVGHKKGNKSNMHNHGYWPRGKIEYPKTTVGEKYNPVHLIFINPTGYQVNYF